MKSSFSLVFFGGGKGGEWQIVDHREGAFPSRIVPASH